MADCDLTLELDQNGPHVAGDKLSGHLVVHANGDLRFDCSRVTLSYRTSGRGSVNEGGKVESLAEPQEVASGETVRIPFDFEVPSAPLTMRGELVNLSWILRGTLDVPWAFDPKVEEEIEIEPAPREAVVGGGYREPPARMASGGATPVQMRSSSKAASGLIICFAVISVVIMLRSGSSARSGNFHLIQIVVLLAFTLFMLWKVAGRDLKNVLAARGIGTPLVSIGPGTVPRGEAVDVEVTLSPPAALAVARIEAVLRCVERASTGSGKNRSTKSHTAHTETVVMGEDISMSAGASRTFNAKLRVPTSAHTSLDLPDNKVVWEVEVHIVRTGAVDHVTDSTVEVVG